VKGPVYLHASLRGRGGKDHGKFSGDIEGHRRRGRDPYARAQGSFLAYRDEGEAAALNVFMSKPVGFGRDMTSLSIDRRWRDSMRDGRRDRNSSPNG
jgi:hypothetical protein